MIWHRFMFALGLNFMIHAEVSFRAADTVFPPWVYLIEGLAGTLALAFSISDGRT